MTKVMAVCGWIYLVVVLDWYTKKIVGWGVASHARMEQWLNAVNTAASHPFPGGIKDAESQPKLVSDNGSQPTLEAFMKEYRRALVKHADETGWRNDGFNGYGWLYATIAMSIFRFRATRSSVVVKEALGSARLPGVLVVDRYTALFKQASSAAGRDSS